MLDIDAAAVATVGEDGIEIAAVPEGVTFEALTDDAERLGHARRRRRQVHGAQRGALEARPARPRRRRASSSTSRSTSASPARSADDVALLAPARRGRGGQPLQPDRGVRLGLARPRRLLERGRRALRRAGREARVRLAPELLGRDVALRHAPRARRARRRARLGRRRLRLAPGQGADPERPRRPGRDLARHRRLLRRRHAAPRLRHVPGAHRAEHDLRLRLQGRAARRGLRRLARDDPRREGRAEDERLPGEPQPAPVRARRTPTRSPASRSSPTTSAARTARRCRRSTATSSSTPWPAASRAPTPSG